MGYGVLDLQHLALLDNAIDLANISTVCDLGEQDFTKRSGPEESVDRFCEIYGVRRDAVLTSNTAAQVWRAVGRKHLSLDVVGKDFLYFDLNVDRVPRRLRGTFDLVTNCGTTEHVVNQYNAFRTMHDLTRPDGFMYHQAPIAGYSHHGLINYNVRFFMFLARDNGYEFVDALVTVAPEKIQLHTDVEDFLLRTPAFHQYRDGAGGLSFDWQKMVSDFRSTDASVRICLKKTGDRAFATPIDLLGAEVPVRMNRRPWFEQWLTLERVRKSG